MTLRLKANEKTTIHRLIDDNACSRQLAYEVLQITIKRLFWLRNYYSLEESQTFDVKRFGSACEADSRNKIQK